MAQAAAARFAVAWLAAAGVLRAAAGATASTDEADAACYMQRPPPKVSSANLSLAVDRQEKAEDSTTVVPASVLRSAETAESTTDDGVYLNRFASGAQCKNEVVKLGFFPGGPQDCAKAAMQTAKCATQQLAFFLIMWSEYSRSSANTNWECRCCRNEETLENSNWAGYQVNIHIPMPDCDNKRIGFLAQRHGESLSNAGLCWASFHDVGLADCQTVVEPTIPVIEQHRGVMQAEAAGQELEDNGYFSSNNDFGRKPDFVYASALMRAQQTASITFAQRLRQPVYIADYIAEDDWGSEEDDCSAMTPSGHSRRRGTHKTSCSVRPWQQKDWMENARSTFGCGCKGAVTKGVWDTLNRSQITYPDPDPISAQDWHKTLYNDMHNPPKYDMHNPPRPDDKNVRWEHFMTWLWARPMHVAEINKHKNEQYVLHVALTSHGDAMKGILEGHHPGNAEVYKGSAKLKCKTMGDGTVVAYGIDSLSMDPSSSLVASPAGGAA